MELANLVKSKYKTIIFIVLIFLLIALIAGFAQPLKYRAQAKILVVQEFGPETDAYTASKMNEYLGGLLAKVVYSESFFDQTVNNTQFSIDKNYFSGTKKKQIKKWSKTINARPIYDSGMINLQVYHPDKGQAVQISRAVIYTLKIKNNFYHSIDNVDVRIIDSPSLSRIPVKPNIPLYGAIGIIFGSLFGLLFVVYTEDRRIEQ